MLTATLGSVVVAVGGAAAGALLLSPHPLSGRVLVTAPQQPSVADATTPRPLSPLPRLVIAGLAGVCVWLFFEGPLGVAAGGAAGWFGYRLLMSAESSTARREREASARELPMVVGLLAAPLRAGVDLQAALGLVTQAFPGPASKRLQPVVARLQIGVPPEQVWRDLAEDPALGALARALARSQETGAGVVETIEALASDLAAAERGAVEDRARQVGVKAAIPLGLCLLPAFLLLGIVPLVAGLVGSLLAPGQ